MKVIERPHLFSCNTHRLQMQCHPISIEIVSILSQYRFCAGGVGLGAAYAIKHSKGMMPMAIAGVAGTFGDLVYGYYSACAKEVDRYERERGLQK